MREYIFYVYIATNPSRTVFYTGMTNDLGQRIIEHYLNKGKPKTFAGRFYCYCLVYWEDYKYVNDAIARENEIKGWRREKKMDLIKSMNPSLKFLNSGVIDNWPPKRASHRGQIG